MLSAFLLKLKPECRIGLWVRTAFILSGKYLLFYLLQGRLINGTLYRLLLDCLRHLLRQSHILQKANPPVSHTDTTASRVEYKVAQD